MRYDPDDVGLDGKVLKGSGLNPSEAKRVIKELFWKGYLNNEPFYERLQCTIPERKSGIVVHCNYEWKKIPDRNEDNDRFLKLTFMKISSRMKLRTR